MNCDKCKKKFNIGEKIIETSAIVTTEEGQPKTNYYYHIKCFEELKCE